jgi:TPR repeat protein
MISKYFQTNPMNVSQQQSKQESKPTDEGATESTPIPPPPAVSVPINLICSFCDKHLQVEKHKKCPCKTTFYCMNSGCQKEHWKEHKTEHRKIQKALDAVKNEGEKDDDTKSGSKNKTSPPAIELQPMIQEEEQDECPICLNKLPMDIAKLVRFTCCGKGLHIHCTKQLNQTKSENIRDYCPLCRTKRAINEKENIKRLQKWMKKKKVWAQCLLGNKYYHGGCGVKKDVKRAFVLYKLAAEQGDAFAQFNLGFMYHHGYGTKPDDKRAIELYTLSAEQGLARAQSNLGNMYASGQGVEQSFTTAKEWFEKAAAQEHKGAIAALEQVDDILRRLTTTSTDDKKSTSSTTTTTPQEGDKEQHDGNDVSEGQQKIDLTNLFVGVDDDHLCTIDGDDDDEETKPLLSNQVVSDDDKKETSSTTTTQQDNYKKETSSRTSYPKEEEDECPICLEVLPKLPVKFIRHACCGKGMHYACAKKNKARGSKEGKNFCVLCRTKLPTHSGSKEEIERFHFWVERGKAWAMSGLGDRYRNGIGVPHNDKRASELYTMAADQDYVNAMTNLGIMYFNGLGIGRDVIKGKELIMKAATLGHVNAILVLKSFDKHEGNTIPSFTPTRTRCSFCGIVNSPPEVKLNPCSGCHCVYYCSKEHQRIDWKLSSVCRFGHKVQCKELQDLSK